MNRLQSAVQPLKAYGSGEIPIQSHTQWDVIDVDHPLKDRLGRLIRERWQLQTFGLNPLNQGPVGGSIPRFIGRGIASVLSVGSLDRQAPA